ncbi:helix-turn-helix domain-containing protein [Phytohabitans suffuscus]|uniref:Transcriptional regulator n=1 Tax=Phytohabitans suffuscus TaxID=624315 RepID=A0A6F8YWV3_9ACTN|nr:helix-turn-helix transcriptional regulator [Phytohabitans suffuscus]BCB90655.1 transcriptional regulator [Phytohabitans suffuscus]
MDTFGEALRRVRRRAGLSLDALEARVNFSKSYLSKVENGRRHGGRELAERCDTALDARGELVAAYEQDAVQHGQPAGAVAFHDVYRRTFLNLGAAAAAAGVAGLAGTDPRDGAEVTEADLEQLDRIVVRLRALDARHGAADLWDVAASRAQGIASLLDHADYSDQVGTALIELAGRAYMCAGWLATDAGQHDAAHAFYTEALAIAGQAGSPEIQVHALSNLALHAGVLRRPRPALRYVAAAEQALPAQPLGRVPAMLTMRRGRLLSMLGDVDGARQAFTAARHTLDRDRAAPVSWLGFFGHAEIDAVEADAALDLRNPKRGAALLEESLAAYDPRFARNRCLHLVRLAKARTSAGQVDAGAQATGEALDLLDSDVASVRVGTELRLLAEQLYQHRKLPAVADVLARYRTSPYGARA